MRLWASNLLPTTLIPDMNAFASHVWPACGYILTAKFVSNEPLINHVYRLTTGQYYSISSYRAFLGRRLLCIVDCTLHIYEAVVASLGFNHRAVCTCGYTLYSFINYYVASDSLIMLLSYTYPMVCHACKSQNQTSTGIYTILTVNSYLKDILS